MACSATTLATPRPARRGPWWLLRGGDPAKAEADLDLVLLADPDDPEALGLRALARLAQGRPELRRGRRGEGRAARPVPPPPAAADAGEPGEGPVRRPEAGRPREPPPPAGRRQGAGGGPPRRLGRAGDGHARRRHALDPRRDPLRPGRRGRGRSAKRPPRSPPRRSRPAHGSCGAASAALWATVEARWPTPCTAWRSSPTTRVWRACSGCCGWNPATPPGRWPSWIASPGTAAARPWIAPWPRPARAWVRRGPPSSDWNRTLEHDPDDPSLYLGRARAFIGLANWDAALADLERATACASGRADMLAAIAMTYARCLPARPAQWKRMATLMRQAFVANRD